MDIAKDILITIASWSGLAVLGYAVFRYGTKSIVLSVMSVLSGIVLMVLSLIVGLRHNDDEWDVWADLCPMGFIVGVIIFIYAAEKISSVYAEYNRRRGGPLNQWRGRLRNGQKQDISIAHYNRGNALFDEGNYAMAIEDYNAAIKTKPDFCEAIINRGLAYAKRSDTDISRAVEDYTAALRIKPNYCDALYSRGLAYIKRGSNDYDRAIADFNAILRIDPNDTAAKDGLEDIRRLRERESGAPKRLVDDGDEG